MKLKSVMLIVLIAGIGSALAIAIPEGKSDLDVVNTAFPDNQGTRLMQGKQQTFDAHLDLSAIKRNNPNNIPDSQLFQSKSWYKAPPIINRIVSLAPVLPSAPSLPFTYIGKMIDGNSVTLFLSKNGQQYTVKVNDVVEGIYQIEAITDIDADLIYLPMKITQKLTFDSTLAERPSMDAQTITSTQGRNILTTNTVPSMAASVNLPLLSR